MFKKSEHLVRVRICIFDIYIELRDMDPFLSWNKMKVAIDMVI